MIVDKPDGVGAAGGPSRVARNGDVVLDRDGAGCGPGGSAGHLTIMPRMHRAGEPNRAALRTYGDGPGISQT